MKKNPHRDDLNRIEANLHKKESKEIPHRDELNPHRDDLSEREANLHRKELKENPHGDDLYRKPGKMKNPPSY